VRTTRSPSASRGPERFAAGLAIQATTNLRSQPIAPWAGLGVLAAEAAATFLLGGLLLKLRDA